MKLLSIGLARSVWLMHMTDINPRGRNLYSLILPFLLDTYKFKKYPQLSDLMDDTKGIVFEGGEFKNEEGEPFLIKLTVFNFGIFAENGATTVETDFFLKNLFTQLSENFNIPPLESIVKGRDHLSQLYVSTENNLELMNPKLRGISEYVEKNLSYATDAKYQISSLSFWPDPVKSGNPLNFVFERQAGIHFSEKRYFSSAPLQTEKHLELLDKLESILS